MSRKWKLDDDHEDLRVLLGNRALVISDVHDPTSATWEMVRELVGDANRGSVTAEVARSVTLSEYDGRSDCYYAWRHLQDAGAWVWDTDEMPKNDPARFEIMHAIQQAMGLLARRFTDKDLSLATEAKEGA